MNLSKSQWKEYFFGLYFLLTGYPHTGRMHQIRVHLQYLGYPIVNDPLYNNTVWGQEKGKGGNKDLSDEQVKIIPVNTYH